MTTDFVRLYNALIDLVKKNYSYLASKEEILPKVIEKFESEINNVKGEEKFRVLAIQALSLFDDIHIGIVNPDGFSEQVIRRDIKLNYERNPVKNGELVTKYIPNTKRRLPIYIGTIDDIFYLRIDSFDENLRKNFDILKEFYPFKNEKIIIDIRANSGGNEGLAMPIASHLSGYDEALIFSYIRFRTSENDPTKLTEFRPRYLIPDIHSDGRKKVIALIGKVTCSSAESFALELSSIPGTKLIGDTTSGDSGCPQRYMLDGEYAGKKVNYNTQPNELKANWALDLPSWLMYKRDKSLLQGNGIIPDIMIEPTKSIVNGNDKVLEAAIELHKGTYKI